MLGPAQADPLDLEFLADESEQVDSCGEYISADGSGGAMARAKGGAEFMKDFEREESDLSFIILAIIKITVPFDSMASDTFYLRHFNRRMRVRHAVVMAEEVVTGRDVKVANLHWVNHTIARAIVTGTFLGR